MKNPFPFRHKQPAQSPALLRIAIDFDRATGQAKINVNQPINPLDLIAVLNQTMAGTIALAAQQQSLIIDPNKGTNAPLSRATPETPEITGNGLTNSNEPQAG